MKTVVIESGVTSIGGNAFYDCTSLKSITIPDSVTSIGDYAFSDCTGLTSITIPDSVTSIGTYAFRNCTGLTSIKIPDSVTSVGEGAFRRCTKLTSITIPDSVTSIDSYTFWGCTGLTSITIPNRVKSIGRSAFEGCTGLTSITIPDSVTSIGEDAFFRCTGLTRITIGNSVTSIGVNAFSGTVWFDNQPNGLVYAGKVAYIYIGTCPATVTIKNGTKGIADSAFYGCTGLTSITIPGSVTSIGNSAFSGCTGLTSITIPGSVTSIGNWAFYRCTSLTNITIPDSVTSIGSDAFYNTAWYNNQPDGIIYAGKVAYDIKGTCPSSVTIKDETKIINSNAFRGCTGLTSITIPDSVTSIGDNAFYGCTGLTSITIPDSVTSIGEYAFYDCTGLTSVTIGNGVKSIGRSAFSGCTGLKRITIPDRVTSIGNYAFYGCYSLKTVYYKGGTESSWAKISIGDGNTYLINATRICYFDTCGENVFYNIDNNTLNIVGSGTMDSYKTQASVPWYDQKDNITCVRTDKGVSKIGTYSFNCLGNLKNVIIQNKNADIGKYAFNTNNKNIKVFAESGGNIATYCINNGINYVDPKPQATTKSITSDTITINAETGFEYSINGTTDWQTEGVFTGLNPVTTYYIYARNAEVLSYFENTSYKPLTVKTVKRTVTAPAAPVCISNTDTKIVLQSNSLYEYSIDGIYWQKSNIFTNLTHGQTYSLYQRIAETSTDYASSASEPLTMKLVKKEVSAPAAPDYEAHTENSITLKPNSKYEFSMDGKNWQKSNVFTNLSKNTIYRFYQRFAETDTEYVSTSSPALITAIPDKPKVINTSIESITVRQIEGFEYCLDDMVWQKSNVFDMLIEDMEYYVYQRIAAIPGEKVYQITSEYTLAFAIEPCVTHTYNGWEKDKNTHWQKCARCGEMTTANSHTFGKWTVVTPATCTNAGKEKQVCTICGYEETRSISATGHKLIEKVDNKYLKSAATCTQKAVYYKSCSICGEKSSGTFLSGNALGHNYKETITPPTCTNQGYTTHTCSRCNNSYKDSYVKALGHTWLETFEKNNNEHWHKCSRCGTDGEHNTHEYISGMDNICYVCGKFAEIESRKVTVGKEVSLKVSVKNADNINSISIQGLTYNKDMLTLKSAKWLPTGAKTNTFNIGTGQGVLTFDTAQNLNGDILELTFKIAKDAPESDYDIVIDALTDSSTTNIPVIKGNLTVKKYFSGDMDDDEKTTDKDATYLLFHLFFPEEYEVNQPIDFNGDGEKDVKDVIHLLFYIYFPKYYKLH